MATVLVLYYSSYGRIEALGRVSAQTAAEKRTPSFAIGLGPLGLPRYTFTPTCLPSTEIIRARPR
jgi:hypothetical protein